MYTGYFNVTADKRYVGALIYKKMITKNDTLLDRKGEDRMEIEIL